MLKINGNNSSVDIPESLRLIPSYEEKVFPDPYQLAEKPPVITEIERLLSKQASRLPDPDRLQILEHLKIFPTSLSVPAIPDSTHEYADFLNRHFYKKDLHYPYVLSLYRAIEELAGRVDEQGNINDFGPNTNVR